MNNYYFVLFVMMYGWLSSSGVKADQTCTDYKGNKIESLKYYQPTVDSCRRCLCNSITEICTRTQCPPIKCKKYTKGEKCCQYTCLDDAEMMLKTHFYTGGLFKSDDDDDNNNEENDQDNDNGIDNDIDNDVDNLSGNDSDYDDFGIFNITTPNYDDTKSALSSTALSPTNIILTKYHNALWRMMYYFTNLTIEILSS